MTPFYNRPDDHDQSSTISTYLCIYLFHLACLYPRVGILLLHTIKKVTPVEGLRVDVFVQGDVRWTFSLVFNKEEEMKIWMFALMVRTSSLSPNTHTHAHIKERPGGDKAVTLTSS